MPKKAIDHRESQDMRLVDFWDLKSDHPDRSSEIVSNALAIVRYSPLDDARHFTHEISLTRLGELNVWRSSSESGFRVDADEPKNIRFEMHFVTKGAYQSETNSQSINASAGQAYLLRNFNRHKILCQPQTAQLCVAIPEIRFIRLATTEFDDVEADLTAMRDFADINDPRIQTLRHLAKVLMSAGSSERHSDHLSVGTHLLKEAFLALFIEVWPRGADNSARHIAKPFYIKRAVDYIHTSAAQKITLEELSAASGVSIRALQLGFRKFLGVSPMAYLLKIRLQRAHKDLLSEHAGVTIEEIAKRWGFSNPSKFAAQIRLHFGVNPFVLRRSSARISRSKR